MDAPAMAISGVVHRKKAGIRGIKVCYVDLHPIFFFEISNFQKLIIQKKISQIWILVFGFGLYALLE